MNLQVSHQEIDELSSSAKAAVAALLAVQAVPVWCEGRSEIYREHVMLGPNLIDWVRTANMWAESERLRWIWAQLVRPFDLPADLVQEGADSARRIEAAVTSWEDIALMHVIVDGLGLDLISAARHSSYGPLARAAESARKDKWSHVAGGLTNLRALLADGNSVVTEERVDAWTQHALGFAPALERIWSLDPDVCQGPVIDVEEQTRRRADDIKAAIGGAALSLAVQ